MKTYKLAVIICLITVSFSIFSDENNSPQKFTKVDQLLYRVNDSVYFYKDLIQTKEALEIVFKKWPSLLFFDLFLLDDIFFSKLKLLALDNLSSHRTAWRKLLNIEVFYNTLTKQKSEFSIIDQRVALELKKKRIAETPAIKKILLVALYLQSRYSSVNREISKEALEQKKRLFGTQDVKELKNKFYREQKRKMIRLGQEYINFSQRNVQISTYY